MDKTAKCKTSAQCEPYIKKIGNPGKIRQCLEKEQKDMEKLEKCVEAKVGRVGCTNDAVPKNLTIPVMQEMTEAEVKAEVAKIPDVSLLKINKKYFWVVFYFFLNIFSNQARLQLKWANTSGVWTVVPWRLWKEVTDQREVQPTAPLSCGK